MSRKAIALYVLLALLLSWTLQITSIGLFGLESPITKVVGVIMMWSPTLLALIFLKVQPAARQGVQWRLGRPAYLPLGIAVEAATGFAVVGILVAAGLATSGWFIFGPSSVSISGGPWLLGQGQQNWLLFVLNVCVTAVGFAIFNLVAATGEEFAWRGFLQGHLIVHFGVRRGILIVSAVWAAWHLPALLAGYNFPEHPYLGALVLFPLQMIGASLFFGWLTIRAGSFWPAALAHGAVNSIQQGVIDNLQLHVASLYSDLLRTGLILLVGIVCWIALTPDRNEDSPALHSPCAGRA